MHKHSTLAIFLAFLLAGPYFAPFLTNAQAATPPHCVLSSPPGQVQSGAPVRLIWVTNNTDYAHITRIGEINPQERAQGSRTVYVTENTLYTMTVRNRGVTRTCSALIIIQKRQTTTTPTYTPVIQQYPVYQQQPVNIPATQYIYIPQTTRTTPTYTYSNPTTISRPSYAEYEYVNDYDTRYRDYSTTYDRYYDENYHWSGDTFDYSRSTIDTGPDPFATPRYDGSYEYYDTNGNIRYQDMYYPAGSITYDGYGNIVGAHREIQYDPYFDQQAGVECLIGCETGNSGYVDSAPLDYDNELK